MSSNPYAELVYASSFPEFFYKENDQLVSKGNPVGVDIYRESEVSFILFEDIYWRPDYEGETPSVI